MIPAMEFDGITAIVTGGASGIGQATARLLLERGAQVGVLDLRTDGAPEGSIPVACDVTDTALRLDWPAEVGVGEFIVG